MEQIQSKTREYVEHMVGNQAVALCEARARIEALLADNAALKAENESLKQQPDGDVPDPQ